MATGPAESQVWPFQPKNGWKCFLCLGSEVLRHLGYTTKSSVNGNAWGVVECLEASRSSPEVSLGILETLHLLLP